MIGIVLRLRIWNWEFILNEAQNKKVLIICNTVNSAQKIYQNLNSVCDNLYLLHSRFIKKDRNLLEEKVIEFSKGNEPGICISTQIVEASLDIDFDVLFTHMSSIDSLIQRMGRVYRNRENKDHIINIYVYETQNGIGSVYDKDIYDSSLTSLQNYNDKIFYETDKYDCVNEVYSRENIENTNYYKKYNKKMNALKKSEPFDFDLKSVETKFRDISNVSLLPNKIFEENKEKMQDLIDKAKNKHDFSSINELYSYCIQYNSKVFYSKKSNLIDKSELVSNSNIYRTQSLYEFDEKSLKGRGLVLEEKENEENNFL